MDELESDYNDQDIEDEIARELSSLDVAEDAAAYVQDEAAAEESPAEESPKSVLPETKFMHDLQKKMSSQRKDFEKQLKECSSLIHSAEDKLSSCKQISLGAIYKDYSLEGDEADLLAKIYEEIAAEDLEDENMTDDNSDVDLIESESPVMKSDSKDSDSAAVNSAENMPKAAPRDEQSSPVPESAIRTDTEESQALVLYDESNIPLLQRKAKRDMRKLADKQKHSSEEQEKDRLLRVKAHQAWTDESETERARRLETSKSEELRLKTLASEREQKLQGEIKDKESRFSAITQQFESQIYHLEKQTQDEQTRLLMEINTIKERRKNLEDKSAITIQSVYRGYRVRCEYGDYVKGSIADRKDELEQQKIKQAEKRIAKQQLKKKQEEEEKRIREEKEAKKAEEDEQRALAEKKAREEEIREKKEREAEEKRLKEAKKQEEKERKAEEARRKKEEKERIKREKAEEQKRIKEEKERKEQEEREAKERKQIEEKECKERGEKERKQKEELEHKQKEADERKQKEKEDQIQREAKEKAKDEKERKEREKHDKAERGEQEKTNPKRPDSDKHHTLSNPERKDVELLPEHSSDVVNSTELTHGVISQSDDIANSIINSTEGTIAENGGDPHDEDDSEKESEASNLIEVEEKAERQRLEQVKAEQLRVERIKAEELAEKKLKQAQYKAWMEERKAANTKSSAAGQSKVSGGVSKVSVSQVGVDTGMIEAKIEERRLRWIQDCTPWSQVSTNAKNSTAKPRKSLRRPTSAAKKHEPVSEQLILEKSACLSLSQVEAVQLEDLPGCTLSTLTSSRKLKALSLTNCGICAVDSLDGANKLQYAHLKSNTVDSVTLTSASLVYLNLSHNNLHAIRGFEACANIRYLNLSNNKISKLANLGFHKRLHALDISHNELISTRGLGDCVTLQSLDISNNHLTNIDELEKLCLLRMLNATGNNIMEIPRLANNILLETLLLDDNSISSLDGLAYCWVPCLVTVSLSQNAISTLQTLHGTISLKQLTLTHNQLIDSNNIKEGLKFCVSLEKLDLEGNPAYSKECNRMSIISGLPQLKFLDSTKSTNHKPVNIKSEVLTLCNSISEGFSTVEQKYQHITRDHLSHFPTSNQQLLQSLPQLVAFYDAEFTLAENARYAHEYGTMTVDLPQTDINLNARDMFESKLIDKSLEVKRSVVENVPENSAATSSMNGVEADSKFTKDMFEQRLRATLESTPLKVSSENIRLMKDSNSPRSSFNMSLSARKSKGSSSRSGTPVSSRGHRESRHNGVKQQLNTAATRIQAWWRGASFRRRLMRAFEQAKQYTEGGSHDDSDEEIAEVDLSKFDYNVDDDWLAPEQPDLPHNHAVLPPTLNLTSIHNGHDYEPREVWQPSPHNNILGSSRHPGPPLSGMSGDISHRSKREESIQQDWGFKDAHTAELMMKRAKKLKYNAQRKNKLSKLDAVGRYEFQKKVQETVEPPKVIAPVRKTAPKKEYFKALEEEARRKDWAKTQQKDAAVDRTYEWIHTQVKPGSGGERVSSGESQLPYMDKRVLEGGRAQLVGSPLEIMSVDSYYGPSSASSHRTSSSVHQPSMDYNHPTHGNSSIHSGKKGHMASASYLQHTSSSRNQAKKAAQQAEAHNLDGYNAWGSGKKRSRLQ